MSALCCLNIQSMSITEQINLMQSQSLRALLYNLSLKYKNKV